MRFHNHIVNGHWVNRWSTISFVILQIVQTGISMCPNVPVAVALVDNPITVATRNFFILAGTFRLHRIFHGRGGPVDLIWRCLYKALKRHVPSGSSFLQRMSSYPRLNCLIASMISWFPRLSNFLKSHLGGDTVKYIKSETIRAASGGLDSSWRIVVNPLTGSKCPRRVPYIGTHSSSRALIRFLSPTTQRRLLRIVFLCFSIPFQMLESLGGASTSWKFRWRRYFCRSIPLHSVFGDCKNRQTRCANVALFCVSTFLTLHVHIMGGGHGFHACR